MDSFLAVVYGLTALIYMLTAGAILIWAVNYWRANRPGGDEP